MKKHTFKQAASQGAKQGAKKAAKQLWKKINPQWRKKQKGDALVQEPSAGRVSDGASWTYKKCWKRQGQSFIGQDISTWGQAPSSKHCVARGDPGINRLDRITKQHDIDYGKARHLKDKHKADRTMIARINKLLGRKTRTEGIVKKVM